MPWLHTACGRYQFDVVALYQRLRDGEWPLIAANPDDLERQLSQRGQFLPLPTEPAALANILEVSIVDYLLRESDSLAGYSATRGTERGYPDLELTADDQSGHYAVDVKVARRAPGGRRTQSRITLYTGNTYFRWPQLRWPGMFRPFGDYSLHTDVIVLYTLDRDSVTRACDVEVIVQEAWRVASRQRSSTTREYIGAVDSIAALRAGDGEFDSEDEFYRYWRAYPFRTGRVVEQQLRRLLEDQR